MVKIAVFVEGQTELLLIQDFLLKKFNYSNLSIECLKLFKDNHIRASYNWTPPDAKFHFQILWVGNDQKVLSHLLKREDGLIRQGYLKVVAIRDMYSRDYREKSNQIDPELIESYRTSALDAIKKHYEKKEIKTEIKIALHYCIMEIESVLLSAPIVFRKMNEKLTVEFIEEKLGFNIDKINPETEFFHPTSEMEKIFELGGVSKYNKSEGEVYSFLNHFDLKDIDSILGGKKCKSFVDFWKELEVPN